MILHCTLVAAPGSLLPAGPVELAAEVPAECPGALLQEAISRRYGTGDLSVEGSPVRDLRVGDAPLRNGAVLVDGAASGNAAPGGVKPGPPEACVPAPQLFLAVHSGPGAGILIPLGRGRYRIGRGGADIVLPDAELSREHAQLDVSDSAVTLEDLQSANGTTVDGERVHRAVLTTDSVIRCGRSTFSLLFGGASAATAVTDAAGRSVAEPLLVGNPAGFPSGGRATVLLMAALPLGIGVALAVTTGMWMFLAFSLVSAASLLVPALAGRKQRRALKAALGAALREDRDRRRRAAPSAAELCADSARPQPDGGAEAGEPGAVWLRLGLAEQPANISRAPADPGFRAPPLGLMPLTLEPTATVTALHGPPAAVAGLVRSCLVQLAAYPAAHRTHVLVHGRPEHLPLAARFLPRVTLSSHETGTAAALGCTPGPGRDRGVLFVLGWEDGSRPGPGPATSRAAALGAKAAGQGWQVILCLPRPGPPETAAIVLGGRSARLRHGRLDVPFLPDLVPEPVFDNFCRRTAAAAGPTAGPRTAITAVTALAGVLPLGAAEVARRWAEATGASGLPVPVGMGRSGPVQVDIERDGPHLLVAGTTGSGKSEFLRTLVASLAASYPPDRVSLLFMDFKGGSGLGSLTGLPHCVGMLSDLGLQEVDRTLTSLHAEVRRREEVLAAARAGDLLAYNAPAGERPALPHLVIVIDEFRVLVDEAPRALSELMRIAAIGRSLGIHLVMATQRPQGAISADIRANVTSRVVLRVQSGMESIDVLHSAHAADIPVATPGRAFLARGADAPQEFQTATLIPDRPAAGGSTLTVLTAAERLSRPSAGAGAGGERDTGTQVQEAAAWADAIRELWTANGGVLPRRPVTEALPAVLPYHPVDESAGSPPPASPEPASPEPVTAGEAGISFRAATVRLGWLDMPERQCRAELCWRPDDHGHLGLIGGGAGTGGTDAALMLVVDQLLTLEQESHLYILDAAGVFTRTAASPRAGAVAGPHEVRRAARVLERVAAEMIRRLGAPNVARPRLVLVLSGWGHWVSAFRSGPLAHGEDLVQDIVRDGPRAGITVLISGERELTMSRSFGGIANRLYFPAGSSDEERFAWPRLPVLEVLPGRVAASGPFTGGSAAPAHAAQLYAAPAPGFPGLPGLPARQAPFRVEALPHRVPVSHLLAGTGRSARSGQPRRPAAAAVVTDATAGPVPGVPAPPGRRRLCIGVGGDELGPVWLTVPAGGVLAVLGGPGSGKTGMLAALRALNPQAGDWLQPGARTDPAEFWGPLLDRARAGGLDARAVLLADDVDLQSEESNRHLLGLNSLGWTVVLTAGFGPGLQQRVPLAQCARRLGTGILICPRSLLDGDLFGVRFEVEAGPPPGRAVLISDGRADPVQLAHAGGPQPRSGGPAQDAENGPSPATEPEVTRRVVKRRQ